jgi:hypothetical protein
MAPKPKIIFLIELSFGRLNSRPIVNIRKTIPNSTKCFTDSVFGNKPNANGPKRRPTKKYAIVEEILRYLKTATAATELTRRIRINSID